ncbi:MAG TPA: alpha/beta hydrolase [Acidimicrobiales bacterium]|nr:alpha/beta hydrolase [Acidimicrobiales bacterium]
MTEPLHLEAYGDPAGEPVLAIHGITAFGARFQRLAASAPGRRWLCPDLRGHGRSPSLPPWRTEDHVADLLRVLDDHDVETADVVGHSFGGHVALHLSALAPDRVGRLVLLDPASLLDPARAEAGALEYARDPGWTTREDAVEEISSWFPTEASLPDLQPEIDHNLVEDDGRWRMRFSPVVVVAAYGEMCRPLPDLPDRDVLLVEADPEQSSVNDRLRDALASAWGDRLRREVVNGAGHVLFRTHPDETAAAVAPFLAC